jgi:hypothetical protein
MNPSQKVPSLPTVKIRLPADTKTYELRFAPTASEATPPAVPTLQAVVE